MALLSLVRVSVGSVDVLPGDVRMISSDSLATITAASYLTNSINSPEYAISLSANDIIECFYNYANGVGTYVILQPSISNGVITLNNLDAIQNGPVSVPTSISSATPGTVRSLLGKITESATVMTSGNIVGVRGEADLVGASGGFVYGVQGKVIPTGTLSGSTWIASLFGQFDLSAPAVINGAQLAAVWGDWGTTGGTATDLSGCRGFAFTNTTANVLNAQQYMYGNSTYLLELAGAGGTLNYYKSAGTASGSAGNSTHCAAQQVIEIEINGSPCYIPVFTQNT